MSNVEFCVALATAYLIASGFSQKRLWAALFAGAGIAWAILSIVAAFI